VEEAKCKYDPQLFPDYFLCYVQIGRLSDLCQPCHQRYRIAVAKIMGHNMDAVVCDKVETARSAIEYLKRRQYKPETFLACDYVSGKPVSDNLRYFTLCKLLLLGPTERTYTKWSQYRSMFLCLCIASNTQAFDTVLQRWILLRRSKRRSLSILDV
jgi:hypothetical protein